MKKTAFLSILLFLFSLLSNGQFTVSKMIGKDAEKFGMGYGLFAYLDIPLTSENQSIRIELLDFALYPSKGENFFTSTADSKAYLSIRAGYKYVFSESQAGFYILPSAGFGKVMIFNEGEEDLIKNGIAGALEGGYTFEIGQNANTLNFGLKYEYDRGGANYTIQSLGLKISYGFGLFRRRSY